MKTSAKQTMYRRLQRAARRKSCSLRVLPRSRDGYFYIINHDDFDFIASFRSLDDVALALSREVIVPSLRSTCAPPASHLRLVK